MQSSLTLAEQEEMCLSVLLAAGGSNPFARMEATRNATVGATLRVTVCSQLRCSAGLRPDCGQHSERIALHNVCILFRETFREPREDGWDGCCLIPDTCTHMYAKG